MNMKKTWMGFCSLLLVCMLVLSLPVWASGEADGSWTCGECGQGGNFFNYCTGCSAARSAASYLNDDSTDGYLREEVDILRVDSSSFIAAKKDKYKYACWNATDNDPSTWWEFSTSKGLKKKAWIDLELEADSLDEIWIRNGLQYTDSKGKYLYSFYSRMKDIRVTLYISGQEEGIELPFTLSDDTANGWTVIELGHYENVVDVKINIDSIYKAKKNPKVVCVTDLMPVKKTVQEEAPEQIAAEEGEV